MEQNMKERWGENKNAPINCTMKLSFIRKMFHEVYNFYFRYIYSINYSLYVNIEKKTN